MFDIGSTKLILIAVIALIAIGPKELPGVLRMVGQWMGKARKMASEFQGQFQEAMREAEMAEFKKSFDEIKDAAVGLRSGSLMKNVSDALSIDKPGIDKPVEAASSATVESVEPPALATLAPARPTTPEATPDVPTPASPMGAEVHTAAGEPLAIVSEDQPAPKAQNVPEDTAPKDAPTGAPKDTTAS